MGIVKHENNGLCAKCAQIFDRYPGFYHGLRAWFENFQAVHPEGHISCAGRGEQDQEAAYLRRASKAHFPHSAHNWNAAIDVFVLKGQASNIYDVNWFRAVLGPVIPPYLNWYGKPGSAFYELPHIEILNWRDLARGGALKPVEDTDVKPS